MNCVLIMGQLKDVLRAMIANTVTRILIQYRFVLIITQKMDVNMEQNASIDMNVLHVSHLIATQ